MIIRVKLPDMISRVELKDNATIEDLLSTLSVAHGVENVLLACDIGFLKVLESKPGRELRSLGIANGDIIHGKYLRDGHYRSEVNQMKGTEMSTLTASGDSKEKKEGSSMPCRHPPSMVCPICIDKRVDKESHPKKATDPSFLCNHPPGVTCPDCKSFLKELANDKGPTLLSDMKGRAGFYGTHITNRCNHHPSMRCTHCVGIGESSEEGSTGKKRSIEKKCSCGPHQHCLSCLPKGNSNPYIIDEKIYFRCPNHGPHGSCTSCLHKKDALKIRIKHEAEAMLTAASIDGAAGNSFQMYLSLTNFWSHRCGILYGSIEDDGSIRVDCIYEPMQTFGKGLIHVIDDVETTTRVDRIAELLGMTKIGFMFSQSRTKDKDIVMAAHSLATAAVIRSSAPRPDHFVVVAVSASETGGTEFEAYQVSDQFAYMFEAGLVLTGEQDASGKVRTRRTCIVEGSETQEVDLNFFLTSVNIRRHESYWRTDFAVENRDTPQELNDLKEYYRKNSSKGSLAVFSDFHFLLYMTQFFSVESDFPLICDAVRERKEVPGGFELLLQTIVEQ